MSALLATALPDWNYYAEDDGYASQAHNGPVRLIRGKMLGGSSGLNLMFYVRGHKLDYDNWAAAGNDGWDFEQVVKYFKKSEKLNDEKILNGATGYLHGVDGYLGVSKAIYQSIQTNLMKRYLKAFMENGFEYHEDPNVPDIIGIAHPQFTINNKKRQSTARAFLKPLASRSNLYLLKKTRVRKVIFNENSTAVGVEVQLPNKDIINVLAEKEVILSAGAINSPQLLMLSGIGPKEHLAKLGIDLVLDAPMVGENLQDHAIVPISLSGLDNNSSILQTLDALHNLDKLPMPVLVGFRAVDKNQRLPDYEVTASPTQRGAVTSTLTCSDIMDINDDICQEMASQGLKTETLFALLSLSKPKSRGKVSLQSNNPEDLAKVKLGYFSDPADLDMIATCITDYTSLVNTPTMKRMNSTVANLKVKQCDHLLFGSHEYWKCYALNLAGTMWHQSGTCMMGVEGEGVVDPRLRVWGVKNLRVVDASIMPIITSGNTNAPTIMIGEKAADMIKEDHGIDNQIYINTAG